MSAYYGRLQGGRGEATRCGSTGSGIRSSVETWQSCIRSEFRTVEGDALGRVEVTDKHGSATGLVFDIDADGLARFAAGRGIHGEYGGDDVEATAALDEVREEITSLLATIQGAAAQINDALAREVELEK